MFYQGPLTSLLLLLVYLSDSPSVHFEKLQAYVSQGNINVGECVKIKYPPTDYINVTSFIDGYKILLQQEGKVTDLVSGSVRKHLHWRDCREGGMRRLEYTG